MPANLLLGLFALTWFLSMLFVWLTSASLPLEVVSKFDLDGVARAGRTARDTYLFSYMTTMGITSVTIGLSLISLPSIPLQYFNMPHRDYWLAPKRKAATIAYVMSWGAVLGTLTLLLLCAVHYAIVLAHAVTPPRMPEGALWGPLGVYLAIVGFMIYRLWRRFSRPGTPH